MDGGRPVTPSISEAARETPDGVGLVMGERAWTYADLAAAARRATGWLARHGILPGETRPVALTGSPAPEALALLHALFDLGVPVALVHPRLTAGERAEAARRVGPVLRIDDPAGLDLRAAAEAAPPTPPPDDDRPLAILFTSGTTGSPRGVVLSRRAFVASARASARNLGWRDDDRWLLGLPVAHVGGLSIVTRCLLARRSVVVPEAIVRGERLDPAGLAREIEARRVTLLSLVPTQLEWLLGLDPEWRPPPALRAILLGGAGPRVRLLAAAADRGIPVLTTYGLTEACSQVTTQRLGTTNRGELGAGPPMDGAEVRIVDGVIQIRGPTLLSGYVHPGGRISPLDAEGWLVTDDLGTIDGAGNLHVLGRRSERVVRQRRGAYSGLSTRIERLAPRSPVIAATVDPQPVAR